MLFEGVRFRGNDQTLEICMDGIHWQRWIGFSMSNCQVGVYIETRPKAGNDPCWDASKSPAERKAAQRARQSAAGERKIELVLDEQEQEMLARNCAARRPGREPYEMAEYIALLIRQDDARAAGLTPSANGAAASAATNCRWHHARTQEKPHAG
jgi:hypothetical protein